MTIYLDEIKYQNVSPDLRDRFFSFARSADMQEAPTDSVVRHYLRRGPGNGHPVLFFTGALKHPLYSFAVIEALCRRCRVIAPVQPACHTLAEYFDGIDSLLNHESIKRFSVVGSSWGGQLAQVAMRRYRDRIDRAILSSTGVSRGRVLSTFMKLYRWRIKRRRPAAVVNEFRNNVLKLLAYTPALSAFWQAVLDDIYDRQMSFDDYLSLIDTQIDYVDNYAADVLMHRFCLPVLILRARDESAGTARMHRALIEAFPQAEVHQFNTGGHSPAMSNFEAFRGAVERFLVNGSAK